MVHRRYHFSRFGTVKPEKWCTWYAILTASRTENRENGASGTPFLDKTDIKHQIMVLSVHHFRRFGFANPTEWFIQCTIWAP